MISDKPPQLVYGALGVLLFAVACEGMYIAYLRGQLARGGSAATTQTATLKAESTRPQAQATPVSNSPPPPQVEGGRVITAEQKAAMLEKLGGTEMSSRPVWFATTMQDPESVAYQRQLQSVFEEAGWQVIGVSPIRFASKPGIFLFSGDEEPPDHVQSAVDALEAAQLAPMVGRGYREFYKEKKQENPSWNGFELSDEQTYVIVVGRNGEPAAAAPAAAGAPAAPSGSAQ
jgi:hypothetical protein